LIKSLANDGKILFISSHTLWRNTAALPATTTCTAKEMSQRQHHAFPATLSKTFTHGHFFKQPYVEWHPDAGQCLIAQVRKKPGLPQGNLHASLMQKKSPPQGESETIRHDRATKATNRCVTICSASPHSSTSLICMPTIYVNDLAGCHLDFWVARAEDIDAIRYDNRCLIRYVRSSVGTPEGLHYAPSLDPAISGPLIEKHAVDIFESGERWAAEIKHRDTPWGSGANRVEAALRAIVAARFGDVVDDPEITPTQHCFWLAFVMHDTTPEQYLGHAIIEAQDMHCALDHARKLAMYPGSDMRVYHVHDDDASLIAQNLRNRLLTREETAQLGWTGPHQ
jgi:hypothetical protein